MQGLVTGLANNVGGLALARSSNMALSIGRFHGAFLACPLTPINEKM